MDEISVMQVVGEIISVFEGVGGEPERVLEAFEALAVF